MRSDIDLVIRWSRRIELLLVRRHGATGRGLHAKISSAAPMLPPQLVRQLRWIATLRNRCLHEDGFRLRSRADFVRAARGAVQRLGGVAWPGGFWAAAAALAALGVAAWLWR